MIETISSCIRTARKQHTCDLCGTKINPGEKYHYSFMVYDGNQTYDWKEHEKCAFICSEIWDYCDPWDGMTYEIFDDAVTDIRQVFVCPDCEGQDEDGKMCAKCNCVEKVYDLLTKYELYMEKREGMCKEWKIRERSKDGAQE